MHGIPACFKEKIPALQRCQHGKIQAAIWEESKFPEIMKLSEESSWKWG
jgi:hypothetical protein